ncbi:MAG: TrmJ/YjtD family RNA methyltransferase [Archaeoglobaceae archaeon]|nr:TrmJ/YjtD family RNA methyltransferase [Archaeoglobaceae archaeon]MCX8152478.1 TrmJ/YjtD family RNA methyltransferase [Archaeoglobaceae archaeon]MDW8013707.1 TrmJ/YjtD family RNA methyltransferase [Archaeoglobaceae archaeon]
MIHVVLVELKVPENIGFIARLMKNFGIKNLWLYRCNVTQESYYTAAHAKDVLDEAKRIDDLFSILSSMNFVIGTTGVEGAQYRFLRKPIFTPEKVLKFIKEGQEVAVLFGREDFGLLTEELEACHAIVKVPTSEEYPIMNVSHAAAVVLYFLSKKEKEKKIAKQEIFATGLDIEVAVKNLEDLLKAVEFPEHRIRRTLIVFRRILGRSKLRKEEVLTLDGIFRKTLSYIKRKVQQ